MGRLLGPAELRALADRLSVAPRKSLGQNFVVDPNTIRRIVRLAGVRPGQHVLEVGPGLGSLTLGLLAAGARVTAVEADRALARALPETVAARDPQAAARLTVRHCDALTLSAADLGGRASGPTALVANLPYNVAVPVLLHCFANLPSLADGLVMLQAEIAARLAAPPGSRTYGAPSVKLGYFATVRRAGQVSRQVFWPVPRVDSELLELHRTAPPPGPPAAQVFAVVDAAFRQRRKTLRGALAEWAGSRAAAEELLRAAGLSPGARGEALTVAEFARLAGVRERSGAVASRGG